MMSGPPWLRAPQLWQRQCVGCRVRERERERKREMLNAPVQKVNQQARSRNPTREKRRQSTQQAHRHTRKTQNERMGEGKRDPALSSLPRTA